MSSPLEDYNRIVAREGRKRLSAPLCPPDPEKPDEPQAPVPTHADTRQPRSAEYLAPPPREIGEVTSAFSTLTHDIEPMSAGARAAVFLISAAVAIAIGLGIGIIGKIQSTFWLLFWPTVLLLIALVIAWLSTQFSHTSTYVGREGVARFTCAGSRDNVQEEAFAFRDAADLRTSQVRRYTNGVYQGTDYSYTWTDVAGRARFLISGTHGSEAGTPPPEDPYHFAVASELAWSLYLLDGIDRQIMTKGEVRFNLRGSDYVAVGPEALRLRLGSKEVTCATQDIGSVSIHQGVFTVKRKDAKEGWFSSSGVFKFDYGSLANAQLFLFVVQRVAGVEVQ